MSEETPRLFEVRYPNGDTVRLYAGTIYYTGTTVTLVSKRGEQRDTVFFAALTSGVTITQPGVVLAQPQA